MVTFVKKAYRLPTPCAFCCSLFRKTWDNAEGNLLAALVRNALPLLGKHELYLKARTPVKGRQMLGRLDSG